jgi:hypothetical protein
MKSCFAKLGHRRIEFRAKTQKGSLGVHADLLKLVEPTRGVRLEL